MSPGSKPNIHFPIIRRDVEPGGDEPERVQPVGGAAVRQFADPGPAALVPHLCRLQNTPWILYEGGLAKLNFDFRCVASL